MVNSIELSIEETNKLRAQIGLPLIPTETSKSGRSNNLSSLDTQTTNNVRNSKGIRTLEGENTQAQNGAVESKYSVLDSHKGGDKTSENTANNTCKTSNHEKTTYKHENQKNPRISFQYDDVDTDSWLESLGAPQPVNNTNHKDEKTPNLGISGISDATIHSDTPSVSVKHSAKKLGSLADGEILTLADNGILDDSGDELVNEKLTKEAKLARDTKERQKEGFVKFGKPRFAGESGEEDDSDAEEFHSALLEGGTISLAPKTAETTQKTQKSTDETSAGHTTVIQGLFDDLDEPKTSVPMKKIKAKKSKGASKKRSREDDLIGDVGPMYTTNLVADSAIDDEFEENFDDMLSRTRIKKNKARKLLSAEEIAQEVKSHKRLDLTADVGSLGGSGSAFVYDDTKDFLDTIGAIVEPKLSEKTPEKVEETAKTSEETPEKDEGTPKESGETAKKVEETAATSGKVPEIPFPDSILGQTQNPPHEHSKEPNLNSLSSTLKYLRSKTNDLDSEGTRKSKTERDRQKEAELAKIQINIEERLLREQFFKDPVFLKMKAEEQENVIDRRLNEKLVEKGIVAEARKGGKYSRYSGPVDPLKDYSPQVSVEYKDSQGNKLNSKQAWKELSHRYHGSGPKHKKEPVVRKTTEERVIH